MRWVWIGILLSIAGVARGAEPRSTPKLQPVPWSDQEALTLANMAAADVRRLSKATVFVAVRGEGGRWSLRKHEITSSGFSSTQGGTISAIGTSQTVEVDAETLFPSVFTMHRTGRAPDTVARFAGGQVEVAGARAPRTYDLEDAAFDDSEIPFVLRRLSLEVGRPIAFRVFAGGLGVYPIRVVPIARETVTVPAGTFECVKVQVEEEAVKASRATIFMPGGVVDQTRREHFYWLSTDEHRYLVKEDQGGDVSELVKVSRWDRETAWPFDDGAWKVSLTTPAGWTARPLAAGDKPWTRGMAMMSGDAEVVCSGRFTNFLLMMKEPPREPPIGWRPETARAYAERELKNLTRLNSEGSVHTMRGDSWTETTIDGLPAARYVADYKMRTMELVVVTQYVNQPIRAVLSCFAPPAAFEARKSEILALMDSQRLR